MTIPDKHRNFVSGIIDRVALKMVEKVKVCVRFVNWSIQNPFEFQQNDWSL